MKSNATSYLFQIELRFLNGVEHASSHHVVKELVVEKEIEEKEVRKVLDPSKFQNLPEFGHINYFLKWCLNYHLDV